MERQGTCAIGGLLICAWIPRCVLNTFFHVSGALPIPSAHTYSEWVVFRRVQDATMELQQATESMVELNNHKTMAWPIFDGSYD